MVEFFPSVWGELVVGDAELVPIYGCELEGRVVAREREGGGVGVGFPSFLEGGGCGFCVYGVVYHSDCVEEYRAGLERVGAKSRSIVS